MVKNSVVIPIATLSAIVVAGFIFVWWWFPRTWKKGNETELDIMDEEQRQVGGMGREQKIAWAKETLARAQRENEEKAQEKALQKANAANAKKSTA